MEEPEKDAMLSGLGSGEVGMVERCNLSSGWLPSCLVCRFVFSLLTDAGDFLPFMMTSVDITVTKREPLR